jgi:hypothetical protein
LAHDLSNTDFISIQEFESINAYAEELLKLLVSIAKTTQTRQNRYILNYPFLTDKNED